MVHVYRSTIIEASRSLVWEVIRDFNALPDWHPAIADSKIEDGMKSADINCVRNFNLRDGGNIRERLLDYSEAKCLQKYAILESPMELENYVATIRLFPITDNNYCFAEWFADFDCRSTVEHDLTTLVGDGVFQGGFDALKTKVC